LFVVAGDRPNPSFPADRVVKEHGPAAGDEEYVPDPMIGKERKDEVRDGDADLVSPSACLGY
jgi:hypothetical protein